MSIPLPAPAAQFLPHRPPIVMVDTLLENSDHHKSALCIIHPDNQFLNSDGLLDATAIPEIIAQAAAASDSHTHDGAIRPGFLALARDIQIERDLRVNDEIIITATDESPLDGWFVINFELRLKDGTPCAHGEISVCQL